MWKSANSYNWKSETKKAKKKKETNKAKTGKGT